MVATYYCAFLFSLFLKQRAQTHVFDAIEMQCSSHFCLWLSSVGSRAKSS
jgi:hypothetical protein